MKSLEELLWKEESTQNEELIGNEAQAMNQACIAICCGGPRIARGCGGCCPPCFLGNVCR